MAAYDLDQGDTVYVDTGTYDLLTNIVINQQDSGVRIQGVDTTSAENETVFDRNKTSAGGYIFDFTNIARDVTIDSLSMTGSYKPVYSSSTSDADQITISNNRFYGNAREAITVQATNDGWLIQGNELIGTASFYSGIDVRGSGVVIADNTISLFRQGISVFSSANAAQVLRNEVFDNSDTGIRVTSSFPTPSTPAIVVDNRVFGNKDGINVTYPSSGGNRVSVFGNEAFDNTQDGIIATGTVDVEQNIAHDNVRIGIYVLENAIAIDNTSHRNETGVRVGSNGTHDPGAIAIGNRVYDNSTDGIRLLPRAVMQSATMRMETPLAFVAPGRFV